MGNNKEQSRRYYLANRERILARNKLNYERKCADPKFKEYRKAIFKKYYYENRQTVVDKISKSRKENRAAINKWTREYAKINPGFKIIKNLRCRLNAVIRGKVKGGHLKDFLGCTSDELKIYLESKFKPGMSWDNYGVHGWHIDHIKPCAKFDMTDPEEQRRCFHYTNLQPLWATENRRKHDKF